MLTKMVGYKPAPNAITMSYHSMMTHYFSGEPVDAHIQAVWKRRKLDLITLNVVNFSQKSLAYNNKSNQKIIS
ncbi:hypothetical protein GN958_ATG10312 [Phytophthora infestans]|uniref:Uncharacterized protein n=1 Tax=Phytophthora infestans TaxID=4787 RepID=A0A8S9ULU7_PHYIN|nr:hypothetical protein GN958_ATG10312 [Phytophthora infestans]